MGGTFDFIMTFIRALTCLMVSPESIKNFLKEFNASLENVASSNLKPQASIFYMLTVRHSFRDMPEPQPTSSNWPACPLKISRILSKVIMPCATAPDRNGACKGSALNAQTVTEGLSGEQRLAPGLADRYGAEGAIH